MADPYADYYDINNTDFVAPEAGRNSSQEFGNVFLPTLYSFVIIIGFIGNILVVCVLAKHRKQTNVTDICLLNLALADLLFILSLPFLSHYAATNAWVFGNFLCRLTMAIYSFGFYGSIFFMIAMTLDRYVAILHAHTAARYRTLWLGVGVSLTVWTLSVFASLPALVFAQEVKSNVSNESKCRNIYPEDTHWEEFDLLEMNVLGFLLPLLVMVVCYSRIFPKLVALKSTKKHRAVRLIVIVVAVFFCFWTPYNVVIFMHVLRLGDERALEKLAIPVTVTETIAYTHCCLNPVIYAFAGQKFMQRVVRMLRECAPRCFPAASRRNVAESSTWKSSGRSTSTFNL